MKINILKKEKIEGSATEKGTTEHILAKAKGGNVTSNPIKSKNLHETYDVQQSRIKNSNTHANVNQSGTHESKSSKIFNRWSHKLLSKTGLPRKGLFAHALKHSV